MAIRARRALISVHDKSGLEELVRAFTELSIEIISTGGTARAIRQLGAAVTDVAEITGFPEMLDGRVKTLHPRVHAGLLARRDLPGHMATLQQHGIAAIDMVCVNLYPFAQTIARPGCTLEEAIENIDIGGPAMLRSAAKNHQSVYVLSSPSQYPKAIARLKADGGHLDPEFGRHLALEAFRLTAAYDASVAAYLAEKIS